MIRNALSATVLFAFVFMVNTSAALAAASGTDPVEIAKNTQNVFEPIAKVVWWIMVVTTLLFLRASRKSSSAGGMLGGLAVAGICLYNPAGLGSSMQGFANSIF